MSKNIERLEAKQKNRVSSGTPTEMPDDPGPIRGLMLEASERLDNTVKMLHEVRSLDMTKLRGPSHILDGITETIKVLQDTSRLRAALTRDILTRLDKGIAPETLTEDLQLLLRQGTQMLTVQERLLEQLSHVTPANGPTRLR